MAAFVKSYRWKGPVHAISAIDGAGCRELTFAIQAWLDAHPAPAQTAADARDDDAPVVVSPPPVRARRRRTGDGEP